MITKKFEVKNFGRHKDVSMTVDGPIVGILGPNGSGKSTLLEAFEFSLTGSTGEHTLAQLVRNGEGNASVLHVFEKDGKEVTIFRQFGKSPKRELSWDGQKYTKVKDVDALMSKIFAAGKQAIRSAVFIQQGTLAQILFCGDAERRDGFIKITGMEFCASRVNIINGQIQKLEATITDLTPLIQAMGTQKATAAEQVALLNEEVGQLRDYSSEIAWCAEEITNTRLLGNYTMQLGQLTNAAELLASEHRRLLQDAFKLADAEAVEAYCQQLKTDLRTATEDFNHHSRVLMEFQHYDNAVKDTETARTQLTEAVAALKKTNPENKTKAQLAEKQAQAKYHLDVHAWIEKSEQDIQKLKQTRDNAQQELANYGLPTATADDIQQRQTLLNQLAAGYTSLSKFLQMQKKLSKCMKVGSGQEHLTCAECGLTLFDPSELQDTKLQEKEKELASLMLQIRDLTTWVQEKQTVLAAYEKFRASREQTMEQSQKSINEIFAALQQAITPMPKEEAQTEYDQMTGLLHSLPLLEQNITQTKNNLVEKMKAKEQYKLAAQYLATRNQYTRTENHQRQSQALKYQAFWDAFEVNYRLFHDTQAKQEENQKQQQQLLDQKTGLEEDMQAMGSSLTEDIKVLIEQHGQNLEPVQAELQARNEVVAATRGKRDQANAAYTRINQEYQELLRRADVDAYKRALINDLKKLRELMGDSGLPMAVVKYHFGKLAQFTQEALTQMDANFAIAIDPDEDLGFSFVRLDDSNMFSMPMTMLSGGQRSRLCIAFLLAVQRRLIKNVGLLVLDEPSLSLDNQGVESLAELLTSMQQNLRNSEMQVLISDHHPALESCFNNTVRLS